MDPVWISAALSGLAALLAGVAVLRGGARTDPLLAGALGDLQRELGTLRTLLGDEMGRGRDEAAAGARHLREEIARTLDRLGASLREDGVRLGGEQAAKVERVALSVKELADANERRLGEMRRDGDEGGKALREEVLRQLGALAEMLGRTLDEGAKAQGERLDAGAAAQKERLDGIADAIRRLVQANAEAGESLRKTVDEQLKALREGNEAKLEEMRRTVDEKLQGTLEQRLGESFKLVSERLDTVHRGLGEMQSLATGVGDLKRVLTNVKSRGTWAEVSLGALLEQTLTADQFAQNVETVRGSGARVEYAVRLPGASGDAPVWLPIDAKFPVEDYERLLDASERGDGEAVELALRGLETQIKAEGAKICSKYIAPPETTDFAVMYLPTEGLYAEVLRRPGLVDHLQGRCRIMVAGPTNLHAFLNSLRLGFRTLAVEKRSSEVWKTLGEVKTEFAKYGDVLEAVRKKLHEASTQIDKVAVRKRAIDRKLRHVEALPDTEGAVRPALALPALVRDDDDLLDAAE